MRGMKRGTVGITRVFFIGFMTDLGTSRPSSAFSSVDLIVPMFYPVCKVQDLWPCSRQRPPHQARINCPRQRNLVR